MKKTLVVLAIVASMSSAYASGSLFGGDTNNYDNSVTNQGGKGGDGGNASALGIGVGVGNAKASAGASAGASAKANNTTSVGVGVKNSNSNLGVNKVDNTNFNSMGQSSSLANTNVGVNKNDNRDYNSNLNVSKGGSAQQDQGQGQDQMQEQSQTSKQANAQSMTYNEADGVHYSGEYSVKNVPDAVAPSIDPTAPCAIPLTGAGSGVGFSLGLGTAYVDVGCEMREVVRLGLMSGNAAVNAKANEVLSTELDKYLPAKEVETISAHEDNTSNDFESVSIFELTSY
ncbi:MAG: hypothetical protein H6546_07580 [Chitinophagales bacterium]|nr:hypothetical protein [Chitinophagales bacterium]